MDTLDFQCPVCNSKAGQPCTRPTNNGRSPVTWTHYARQELVQEKPSCTDCLGSGRIAVGPWGSRPPKKTCPRCSGTGIEPTKE